MIAGGAASGEYVLRHPGGQIAAAHCLVANAPPRPPRAAAPVAAAARAPARRPLQATFSPAAAAAPTAASLLPAGRARLCDEAVREEQQAQGNAEQALALLKDLVHSHLVWKCRHVFAGLDAYEAQLRRRCLRDRLCRMAQDKYQLAMASDGASWLSYLRSTRGKEHVEKYVERKAAEVAAKWGRMSVA